MINEYTMKQIEFGFTSEYIGGAPTTYESFIKKIKDKIRNADALPSSVAGVQNIEDYRKNYKKIRAYLDILDDMHREDIVKLATSNSKLYLNETEKINVTSVFVEVDSIIHNIAKLLFEKTLGIQGFGSDWPKRRAFFQTVWPKVKWSFDDYSKPEWFTQNVIETEFSPLIKAVHRTIPVSYKSLEQKLLGWTKNWRSDGGTYFKPATFETRARLLNNYMNWFIETFPSRR